jgi:hypothetical protein
MNQSLSDEELDEILVELRTGEDWSEMAGLLYISKETENE